MGETTTSLDVFMRLTNAERDDWNNCMVSVILEGEEKGNGQRLLFQF
jgi:hypothetical protein